MKMLMELLVDARVNLPPILGEIACPGIKVSFGLWGYVKFLHILELS
jgi:hypothetical protein